MGSVLMDTVGWLVNNHGSSLGRDSLGGMRTPVYGVLAGGFGGLSRGVENENGLMSSTASHMRTSYMWDAVSSCRTARDGERDACG